LCPESPYNQQVAKLKLGISVTSSYPQSDARSGARQMIERTRAADQANLDSLFLGDHHITPSNYYQNTPMMGRLLAEWGNRPAGVLFLLPLWNPVLVAEQVATLACLTGNRFILQCGLGAGERQFKGMGKNIRYRPSAFEQSIDTLRSLWKGETVSMDGRWCFQDATIRPLPPEPVEIWIGASAKIAIERASRLGDAWLADPGMTLDEARIAINYYQDCQEKNHRKTNCVAIRRDIYVAETQRDAEQAGQMASGYRGFNPDALVIGEVKAVADQLLEIGDLGYTDIIIRSLHPDPVKALESIQRLAEVKSLIS
jgi:alkanesulfonate monooxygenase SsuD/methylene tetrahydromethanopterin reductase-like flavin-dependent oxidoreductase (luciferase family)